MEGFPYQAIVLQQRWTFDTNHIQRSVLHSIQIINETWWPDGELMTHILIQEGSLIEQQFSRSSGSVMKWGELEQSGESIGGENTAHTGIYTGYTHTHTHTQTHTHTHMHAHAHTAIANAAASTLLNHLSPNLSHTLTAIANPASLIHTLNAIANPANSFTH